MCSAGWADDRHLCVRDKVVQHSSPCYAIDELTDSQQTDSEAASGNELSSESSELEVSLPFIQPDLELVLPMAGVSISRHVRTGNTWCGAGVLVPGLKLLGRTSCRTGTARQGPDCCRSLSDT